MARDFILVYTNATGSLLSKITDIFSEDLRHVYAYQCLEDASIRIDYYEHGIARLNLTHAVDLTNCETLAPNIQCIQRIRVHKPRRRTHWYHGFGASTCADFIRQACGVAIRPVLTPRGLYNNLLKHDKMRNYIILETKYGQSFHP